MQEEADSDLMHLNGFGKGERLADGGAEALAERVVETLQVILGAFGISGPMLSGRQDVVIALQVIGAKPTVAISQRDALPKEPGGGVIARAQRVGDDLAGAPTQGQPQPDHATPPVAHEAPQFIQLQDFQGLDRSQRGLQRRHLGFFKPF